jgi:hypothetical protein
MEEIGAMGRMDVVFAERGEAALRASGHNITRDACGVSCAARTGE